jgi:hypothetical protein
MNRIILGVSKIYGMKSGQKKAIRRLADGPELLLLIF